MSVAELIYTFTLIKEQWHRRGCVKQAFVFAVLIYGLVYQSSRLPDAGLWAHYVAIGAVIAYLLYIIWERFPPLRDKKHYVCLCLDGQYGSVESVNKIIDGVRRRLSELDITNQLKLKVLPGDVIKSQAQADRYIKRGMPIVIWGTYRRDTREDKLVENLVSCRFGTRFTFDVGNSDTLKRYCEHLVSFLNSQWHHEIRCSNTADDLVLATENYVQLIVGLAAPLYLQLRAPLIAVGLAEDILKVVCQPDLKKYLRSFVVHSLICHLAWKPSMDWDERFETLKRIWVYPEGRIVPIAIDLARSAWEVNEVKLAKEYTSVIENIDPGNPCYAFNHAFLSLIDKNYAESTRWYAEAKKRCLHRSDINFAETAVSIADTFERKPDEIGFLFALGMVNCIGLDVVKGKADLRSFISQARKRQQYSQMLQYANSALSQLPRIRSRTKMQSSGGKRGKR